MTSHTCHTHLAMPPPFTQCTHAPNAPDAFNAGSENGVAQRATYDQLEAITCDLSAFPNVSFFRVEVGEALAGWAGLQRGCATASGCKTLLHAVGLCTPPGWL